MGLGARMVGFAGWEMPLQYTGIIEEHQAVRSGAGIFDVSHMGRVAVSGGGAGAFLQRMLTNDLARVDPGTGVYSFLCNEAGGILDDVIAYHVAADRYLVVVNAANRESDLAWLRRWCVGERDVRIEEKTETTAMVALQGPRTVAIIKEMGNAEAAELGTFQCMDTTIYGERALLARTGYTGEDGFELVVASEHAPALWDRLIAAGAKPCGLGARDTLRLEAALPLHGQEIDAGTNPLEAGFGWAVKLGKGPFLGREALLRAKQEGLTRKLVGLRMEGRHIPRHGYGILASGVRVGEVTSGGYAPTLGYPIALGYVPTAYAEVGTELAIDLRGRTAAAQVVRRPFYKREDRQ